MGRKTTDEYIRICQRIDEKTLAGGDYSIAFFMDENGNPVDKSVAVRCHIHEYTKDGRLIMTTYGYPGDRDGSSRPILQQDLQP